MKIYDADLRKLNSMTKYPAIPTYHKFGERGRLIEEHEVTFEPDEAVVYSEKINGTNARILITRDFYLIGSREEFLTADGDKIYNPAEGIVDAVRKTAEHAVGAISTDIDRDELLVLYGEVYGGNLPASRSYTAGDKALIGFRLFDVCQLDSDEIDDLLNRPIEQVARWRDQGGQFFVEEAQLLTYAKELDIQLAPGIQTTCPPDTISDVLDWLSKTVSQTLAPLCDDTQAGRAEGVVVRTTDRKKIVKIRYEDYERTLNFRK